MDQDRKRSTTEQLTEHSAAGSSSDSSPHQSPFSRKITMALALLILVGGLGFFLWIQLRPHPDLVKARREMKLGHNRPAIEHLRAVRKDMPDDREVLILSARVARRSHAWTEAEKILNRYWQLYGDEPDLVLERLLLQATQGKEEALPILYTKIKKKDPAASLAREAILAGLLYRFELGEAEKQIEQWLKEEPNSTFALLAQGKLYDIQERTSKGLTVYRKLLELDPRHDEARMRMSLLLLELSQGAEALSHLQYLRDRLPNNPEVMARLARALEMQGQADEAQQILEQGVKEFPDHPSLLSGIGRLYLRAGKTKEAEKYLKKSIEADPGNVAEHYQYYQALTRNGKTKEAEEEQATIKKMEADIQRIKHLLEVQLKKTPNNPEIYYEVAMIAARAGRPKEMHRWLVQALDVAPNHTPSHRALSSWYHQAGNPILAARHRAIAQRLENAP